MIIYLNISQENNQKLTMIRENKTVTVVDTTDSWLAELQKSV